MMTTEQLVAVIEAELERFMRWPASTVQLEPRGTRKFLLSTPKNLGFDGREMEAMAHMVEYVRNLVPDGRMKFCGFR